MSLCGRLAAGLLFVFTAAYASPDSVVAEVRDDGSVVIEGVRYTDSTPLSVELKQIERRHAQIHIHAKPSMAFEAIGKAILLLQKAGCNIGGCMKIGFITGPASSR